jgi:hypothetical protein
MRLFWKNNLKSVSSQNSLSSLCNWGWNNFKGQCYKFYLHFFTNKSILLLSQNSAGWPILSCFRHFDVPSRTLISMFVSLYSNCYFPELIVLETAIRITLAVKGGKLDFVKSQDAYRARTHTLLCIAIYVSCLLFVY